MAITTRNSVFTNRGKGLGCVVPITTTNATGTAAAASSGAFTLQWHLNNVGTTLPATLVGFQLPPSPPNDVNLNYITYGSTSSGGCFLARMYKLGTLDLTGTGNKFTHDAATFPVLRTQFGETSKPVVLLPILHLTTATLNTAPVFRIRNNTGPGVGYTNQDGTNIIGTVDFTFPAATTIVNSVFMMRLNYGDSGIRDIFQIDVTTASTSGAATIYGAELLCPLHSIASNAPFFVDNMFAGFSMANILSAVATSGTETDYLSGIGTLSTLCLTINSSLNT